MTAISSYYAEVGVGIDKKSIASVTAYLGKIEKQITSFQSRLTRTSSLSLKLSVDGSRLATSLQRSLNAASKTSTIKINSISISAAEVTRVVNRALQGANGNRGFRLGALLSQNSLSAMRSQVRSSLSNLTVSPRINPRMGPVSGGGRGRSGGGGGGIGDSETRRHPGRTSPWHNPMMVGGGTGAFLRYGMASLPFVGGAMGLNALANKASSLQAQSIGLRMTAGSEVGEDGVMRDGGYYEKYLSNLGQNLGKKTSLMTPFFTQMLSGAKGTALEPHLESGFAALMQYSSVMGLGDESTKGAIKAFSQMIGKQQIMAEELRGQAAEHLPPVVRMMADAVTGGDVKKLNKMMEKGELDPNKHLPLLFEIMKRDSDPYMGEYRNSMRFKQGNAARLQEEWIKTFLSGGADKGMGSVFGAFGIAIEKSLPYAQKMGEIFSRMAYFASAIIQVPSEMAAWFNGTGEKNNFMTMLFGTSDGSQLVTTVKTVFAQIESAVSQSMGNAKFSIDSLLTALKFVADIATKVIETFSVALALGQGFSSNGVTGLLYANDKINQRASIVQELTGQVGPSGKTYTPAEVSRMADQRMAAWMSFNPAPAQDNSLLNVYAKNNGDMVGAGIDWWKKGGGKEAVMGRADRERSNPYFRALGDAPANAPRDITGVGGAVNVIVSGKVTVDGSIEQPMSEIQAKAFQEGLPVMIQDLIGGLVNSTTVQFGNGPQ